jgi:hypothetical protein
MDISNFTYESPDGFVDNAYYTCNIGGFILSIYLGVGDSDPEDINLDINNYTYFTVDVSDQHGNILDESWEEKFGIEYLTLFPVPGYLGGNSLMSYQLVTVPQLEKIYDSMLKYTGLSNPNSISVESDSNKIGGKCSICGLNDPWGSYHNGNCYCYLHIPGY